MKNSAIAAHRLELESGQKKYFSGGLTLIEILIAAALVTILMAGIMTVLNTANLSWHQDMGLVDLQQGVRFAMDGMTREMRQADPLRSVAIGAGGDSFQFYITNYTDPISYSLNNNQLIREHPVGVNKILANNVSELDFCWMQNAASCTLTRGSSDVVQVHLRATKTVRQRTLTFPLSGPLVEEVKLRNE